GIGLLVSHDRQFLDDLCAQTLFVVPPAVDLRGCGYSIAQEEREKEETAQQRAYDALKLQAKHLTAQVQKQKAKAQLAEKQRSKRYIAPSDHDAKAKIDLGRLTGKDAAQGRIYDRLHVKLERIETQKKSMSRKKQPPIGITSRIKEAGHPVPFIFPETTISLGGEKTLITPELMISPHDKIGIIGDNGNGKSTCIQHIYQRMVQRHKRLIYIPQEISVSVSGKILARLKSLNSEEIGRLMTLISRLGSEPERVLQTELPTPGEVRKLMLAEGILMNPQIIIMDEPTNHLDLPSMICFESVLKSCECTLLLVSHDFVFLQKIVDSFWHFFQRDEKTVVIRRLGDISQIENKI
ncbi:MAG: ABC transporter ATP-binding protein, partial [Calditrichaeota bacterium]